MASGFAQPRYHRVYTAGHRALDQGNDMESQHMALDVYTRPVPEAGKSRGPFCVTAGRSVLRPGLWPIGNLGPAGMSVPPRRQSVSRPNMNAMRLHIRVFGHLMVSSRSDPGRNARAVFILGSVRIRHSDVCSRSVMRRTEARRFDRISPSARIFRYCSPYP